MIINPYKNRNRILLILEIISTIAMVSFLVIRSIQEGELNYILLFSTLTVIFFIRLVDLKNIQSGIIFIVSLCITTLALILN